METIILCCGKGGCPQLSENEDAEDYTLTDDYGGEVKLTAEELDLLVVKWKDPTREWTRKSD
jgi:hypothetical protein